MEERPRNSLIRSSILLFIMAAITGFIYIQFYSPVIQSILAYRENLTKGEQELSMLKECAKEVVVLTEEERMAWKIAQGQIYQKFPPAETLPNRITFKGSAKLFYGVGETLLGNIPRLFLEVLQLALAREQDKLVLTAARNKNALSLPSPGEGVQPLKLDKSTLGFTVNMSFQELADFIAQLQALPRFIKVTKLFIKPGGKTIKSTITIETYHCQEGVLGDVSGE